MTVRAQLAYSVTKLFAKPIGSTPPRHNPPRRGEGLNCTDFAAKHYGLAFTTELGEQGGFEERVRAAVVSVRTDIESYVDRCV